MCHSANWTREADRKAEKPETSQAAFDRRAETVDALRKGAEQPQEPKPETMPVRETVPAE